MAEFAEQRLQEMVPVFEELERLGLLSAIEVKMFIRKKRYYEYKTANMVKKEQDFVKYVLFDSKLLELLNIRRKLLGITESKNSTDKEITKRVLKRLRVMTDRWCANEEIWELRIAFCKSRGYLDAVSTAFARRIAFHGNSEDLWIRWAQWEIEGRENFEEARIILQSKALASHPKSLSIIRECFRLELLYIEFLKKRQSRTNMEGLEEIYRANRQKVLECGLAEKVFEDAQNRFDTSDIFLQFYTAAEKFDFANKLRENIYSYLLTQFPCDKNVWQLRAKRLLNGLEDPSQEQEESKEADKEPSDEEPKDQDVDCKVDTEESNQNEKEKLVTKDCSGSENEEEIGEKSSVESIPLSKIKIIFVLYDKAMNAVGPQFLTCYIHEMLDLLHQCWRQDKFFKPVTEKLFAVFANHTAHLSPFHFLLWYKIASHLQKSNSELKEIITQANSLHPDCPQIQLELLLNSFANNIDQRDIEIFIKDLRGENGVKSMMAIINHSEEKHKKSLFTKVCHHHDPILSREMRIKHIEYLVNNKAFKDALSKYKEYSFLPPISVELHTAMIKLALRRKNVLQSLVREVFQNACQQYSSHAGLWLSYIGFEKKHGDVNLISNISAEAEFQLEGAEFRKFIDMKLSLGSKSCEDNEENFKDDDDKKQSEDDQSYEFWSDSCLGPVFDDDIPTLVYSGIEERKRFFRSLHNILKELNENHQNSKHFSKEKDELKCWEELLTEIYGETISLREKEGNSTENVGIGHEIKKFVEDTNSILKKKRKAKSICLSDTLQESSSTSIAKAPVMKDEIKKILDSSEVLKPDFIKKKEILPFNRSKKIEKLIRKKKLEQTAGKGWFDMKAPQLTEEVKRDLEILRLRSVLDPHRHYKRNDMKTTPKYFQMGKVVDSPLDFYSSRIVKKQRKNTMAEEIINDEQVLSYQKRKFTEIMEKKKAKKRKIDNALRQSKGKKKKSEIFGN